MSERERPQVGQQWHRRVDKRDGGGLGQLVQVTRIEGYSSRGRIHWVAVNPLYGQRKQGSALSSTWASNYVRKS